MTNTPLGSIDQIGADSADAPARYFDLLGRPVATPRAGSLLINATTRTLSRIAD